MHSNFVAIIMKNWIICALIFSSVHMCTSNAYGLAMIKFPTWKKGTIATCIATASIFNLSPAFAGIDAFDAATKAMMAKSEKNVVDRSFDELSDGAKKRSALALCKESSRRSAAGYSSTSACTEDVLKGIFRVVDSPIGGGIQKTSPSAVAASGNNAKATVNAEPKALVKVQDLSDLSSAQRKRRALAACKKSQIRLFAKMGSESKCTEAVMNGQTGPLIDALEYGL